MKPEEQSRLRIDARLESAGWLVQDHSEMNISAGPGIAVREFPLETGAADYLLYIDGKCAGVVEAKPDGHSLTGVEVQSAKYTSGLPDILPKYRIPLPFAYEATGEETRFTNGMNPQPRSRELFSFHRPEELRRLLKLGDEQLRTRLQNMPEITPGGLWKVQLEAIRGLQESLAGNKPRSLIQMATGSGKTFTACSFCYRLIKFAKAKRILFLVDRNNLGDQTLNEFQKYQSPYTNYTFTEEYNVQHLKRNTIDPAAKVCITTIQRLFSMLKGDDEFDEQNEEQSHFESDTSLVKEPLSVVYNPQLPIETFDFIVIDECHRSIYNLWRQVLDYFDAFLIGLTATPSTQTIGFFNQNVVQDYSHEKAVIDGVNVGYDVYRIETQVSKDGATLKKESDYFVPIRDRRTRKVRHEEIDKDLEYSAKALDRDVVNKSQIRLVIQTFRDRLPIDIFPGREEVPKTLVFAKTDLHADDIVQVIREEFNKGNDFCQKITSKTTGKKPKDLLTEFRTQYNPRIAVTVDMIATGTDVKPLECLLFMRSVASSAYFEQMKGRGCRIIDSNDLQAVTREAKHKTRFVIVDAVGVCERDKSDSKPLDRKPSVSLKKLLQLASQGVVTDELVSTLGARLARLNQQIELQHHDEIEQASGGISLTDLTSALLTSVDADVVHQKAAETFDIPDDQKPTEEQLDATEQQTMAEALKPFHKPELRKILLDLKTTLEQVIDETTQDVLLSAGFDQAAKEKAKSMLSNFRQFLDENREEIEAVQVLYSKPYRAGLRYRQVKELAAALERPPLSLKEPGEQLWKLYEATEPEKVKAGGGKALVDLIALVRHALHPEEPLVPIGMEVEERYQEWLADQTAAGISFTADQRKWLDAIRDHIASSLQLDTDDFEYAPFTQLGGLGKAYELFGDQLNILIEELNKRLAA